MSLAVGLAAALVSIIGWGSNFVPMKRIRQYDPVWFQLVMCASIFVTSLLVSAFFGSFEVSYWAVLSGLLWSAGNLIAIFAVRNSGLARSAPIWMSSVMLGSFLWGLLYFKEPISSVAAGVVGLLLLMCGVIVVSSTSGASGAGAKAFAGRGVLLSLAAGAFFSSYIVPFKLSGLSPMAFLFPMSIGILLGSSLMFLLGRPSIDRKIVVPGFLTGLMWNVANIASLVATLNLGVAIAIPLTQMALFVSVLWGIMFFREIEGRSRITRVVIGAVVLFAGAVSLVKAL